MIKSLLQTRNLKEKPFQNSSILNEKTSRGRAPVILANRTLKKLHFCKICFNKKKIYRTANLIFHIYFMGQNMIYEYVINSPLGTSGTLLMVGKCGLFMFIASLAPSLCSLNDFSQIFSKAGLLVQGCRCHTNSTLRPVEPLPG